jgi:maltose/moltooligosaccharide transporter
MSDRTWGRLGRRRPYFLTGAILATAALIVMPNSPVLWVAAGMLWIMDASINVSMEPFRAFVGDMLPDEQRTGGFAMQSFFIGVGAVVASALPWMMTNWFDVANTAAPGEIPPAVKLAFYWGAAVFLAAVLWTVLRTQEYSPAELQAFEARTQRRVQHAGARTRSAASYRNGGILWAIGGIAFLFWVAARHLDKQLYILAVGAVVFGIVQIASGALQSHGKTGNTLYSIVDDLFHMPRAMQQLAVVQFFSWFALFAMWIYGTAAVTSHHFGATDVTSKLYNDGADWTGVLFAAYNGFAALAAILLPFMAGRLGCRRCHAVNLAIGGLGLISFRFIADPTLLLLPMVAVGIAWASILSLPYVLLSGTLPVNKMGVYMGIFNFFIVIPQLVAASILGLALRELFDGRSIYGLVIGGTFMIVAGATTLLVDRQAEPQQS